MEQTEMPDPATTQRLTLVQYRAIMGRYYSGQLCCRETDQVFYQMLNGGRTTQCVKRALRAWRNNENPFYSPAVVKHLEKLGQIGSENKQAVFDALLIGKNMVSQIVVATGLSKTIVQRYLLVLQHEGKVCRERQGVSHVFSLVEQEEQEQVAA